MSSASKLGFSNPNTKRFVLTLVQLQFAMCIGALVCYVLGVCWSPLLRASQACITAARICTRSETCSSW